MVMDAMNEDTGLKVGGCLAAAVFWCVALGAVWGFVAVISHAWHFAQ